MKYNRHKKIKLYKKIKIREYAILFNCSEQLIEFICHINTVSITSSSLYAKDGYYVLLLSANNPQNYQAYITFEDNLHIDKIKSSARLICKHDAIYKMQKAFIKP